MSKVWFTGPESIPAVIAEMTLEEKALMYTGQTAFTTRPIPRLGIPSVAVLDGAPGINYGQLFGDYASQELLEQKKLSNSSAVSGMESLFRAGSIVKKFERDGKIDETNLDENELKVWAAIKKRIEERFPGLSDNFPKDIDPSSFPAGMMLGATWEPEAVYAVGEACAREFDAYKLDVMLGPNVNIHRDPLNGRVFEGYSEDPMLVAGLAPEFIKGVQSVGIAADPKHFAANNQETSRMNGEQHIPMRALREIYLPGFRACFQKGGAKTVMSAYNKINGTACALNKWLLTDVLRDEWGFDGLVVSDWGAVYDQAEAIKAGNDLEMPANPNVQPIIDAVREGRLDEKILDKRIETQLRLICDLPVMKGRKYTGIDDEHSRVAAYNAACEGIVLLKNNGVLPLKKEGKVCFFGEKSFRFLDCGAGSAEITTTRTSSLIGCAGEILGKDNAVYASAVPGAQAAVITVHAKGQEGRDRPDMFIEPADRVMIKDAISQAKSAGLKTVVILNVAGPVDMTDFIDDADAIMVVFLPGREGAHAASDILFGNVNPSGKLPLTFPVRYEDTPTFGNFPGYGDEVWYGEGIYVGYRYYDAKKVAPAFAFGHGLSYTTFEISGLTCTSPMDTKSGKPAVFTVKVKNTGAVPGKEVVQLYTAKVGSEMPRPVKELKAFKKVFLNPSEEKTVELTVTPQDLQVFDTKLDKYVTELGEYTALAGNASDAIACTCAFAVSGINPYAPGPARPFVKVVSIPACREAYEKHFGAVVPFKAFESVLIYSPDRPADLVLRSQITPAVMGGEEALEKALAAFYAEIANY